MTIFVCLCGNTKTDQPYNSANRHKWVCPQCINQEYGQQPEGLCTGTDSPEKEWLKNNKRFPSSELKVRTAK